MRSYEAEYRKFLDAFGEKLAQAVEDHALPLSPLIERMDAVENAFADIVWEAAPVASAGEVGAPGRGDRERVVAIVERRDDFLNRVERVVYLREEPASLERIAGTGRFGDHLRVTVLQGERPRFFPVGALEWQISLENLASFYQEIVAPYRWGDPGAGALLVHGEPASEDLRQTAKAWQIRLVQYKEYRQLIDFTAYRKWQTTRLAGETAYRSSLYVPQRLLSELGQAGQVLNDALEVVQGWLSEPQGRFILVLGNFGTGKTFLLYELARRLVHDLEGPVPVLLPMRSLEKGKSLSGLLALHFSEAQLGDFSLSKFRYMLEEGLVALLFDGFDELALSVTYKRAVEHFDSLLEAAAGRAKVVATSRKQYFLTDDQGRLALLDRVDAMPGRRITELLPFIDNQTLQFLLRHSNGDAQRRRLAEERTFFISYARARPQEADYVETLLRRRGHTVYRDEADFEPSAEMMTEIIKNINQASVFIALWCREYACSPWCFDEMEMGLKRHSEGLADLWILCVDSTKIVPKAARSLNYYPH